MSPSLSTTCNMETKNAIIKSTTLGIEDHGILTFWLHLEYDGSGQGFGGYALDEYDVKEKRRKGTIFGCQTILDVLRVVGVDSWEKLPGSSVRVTSTPDGSISSLGHFLKDRWLNPGSGYRLRAAHD